MLTQVQVRTGTTGEHPKQPQRLYAAGAGRGSNHNRRPVCVSYPQPGGNRKPEPPEVRHIRTKIDQLLETLNMPGFCTARPIWEQSGNMPAQASRSEGGAAC